MPRIKQGKDDVGKSNAGQNGQQTSIDRQKKTRGGRFKRQNRKKTN